MGRRGGSVYRASVKKAHVSFFSSFCSVHLRLPKCQDRYRLSATMVSDPIIKLIFICDAKLTSSQQN